LYILAVHHYSLFTLTGVTLAKIQAHQHSVWNLWLPFTLALALIAIALTLAVGQWRLSPDDPALVTSTPAQLALWVADQTAKPNPASPLVKLAQWTSPAGVLTETAALLRARLILVFLSLMAAAAAGWSAYHLRQKTPRGRDVVIWTLVAFVLLLFNVPPVTERPYFMFVLAGITISLITLFFAPGSLSRTLGFLVVISALLVWWEIYIAIGNATGNTLPLTQFPWMMPHWQKVAEVMLQPARRNGPHLLIWILTQAAMITWLEALIGFIIGSLLGFGLGILFAHSALLERSLLPYVVASQTVPIIAIAPMIVAFLGQGWLPVAVIAAYLTFFPVTVNTLRGLLSPASLKLELMHTYAANRRTILWKLRVPSALPFIFTALKVSATTSVVGAIVGELPSSRSDGLAAAILRASGNYAAEPEKLWAAIIMASLVGILFFGIVSLIERRVLRGLTAAKS
jgi:NitT/TauT family transport system permease protein